MTVPDDKIPTSESPVRITADATKSLEKATDTAMGFIERVVMPPAEALAGLAVDLIDCVRGPFRMRRLENLSKVSKKVAELRAAQNIAEPIPLPPKSTHIVIEQASFEEDDTIRDLWAQMIVNAQAGMEISAYMFEVLSKLSGADAQKLQVAEGAVFPETEDGIERLVALGLLEEQFEVSVRVDTNEQFDPGETGRHEASSWFPSEAELKSTGFHLTHLGYALLEAVAPPQPRS
jgi:hypothetical protein